MTCGAGIMRLLSSLCGLVAIVVVLPMDYPSQASNTQPSSAPAAATFCQRNPHTCGARAELWDALVQKARGTQALAQVGWEKVQGSETWQSLATSFRSVGRIERAQAALTAEQVEASFPGANQWRTIR
jgi:predicted transglutaminase-like cysteine proteinase